jgi:hypothetical protein
MGRARLFHKSIWSPRPWPTFPTDLQRCEVSKSGSFKISWSIKQSLVPSFSSNWGKSLSDLWLQIWQLFVLQLRNGVHLPKIMFWYFWKTSGAKACVYASEAKDHRGQFLTSPLGAEILPQKWSCPRGDFPPRGEVITQGWRPSVRHFSLLCIH